MKSGIIRIFSLNLSVIICLCWGCGYHFRADGEPTGIKIESIAIPLITSSSSTRGFEADFTRVIREEFISHSKIPIVRKEESHMILAGNVFEISADPLAYDLQQRSISGRVVTYETTSKRRLKIVMDVSLTERTTGKIVWRERSLSEEAGFEVGTDSLTNDYNQQQALKKIARLVARRIYLKTMERF